MRLGHLSLPNLMLQDNSKEEMRLGKVSAKWVDKYHVIDGINNGDTHGFLDIQAGIVIADKVSRAPNLAIAC